MVDRPANIDDSDMSSQETISRLILDQLKSFREDVREALRDVNEDIKSIREDVGDIKDEIGSRDGIRSRLTTLELRTQQAIECSTTLSYPPPVKKKPKTIKDHAPALGAGAGLTTLLYGVVEIVNAYLKTK